MFRFKLAAEDSHSTAPAGAKLLSPLRKRWEELRIRTAAPEGRNIVSHTFAKNHLHVVFSTKERRKSIPKDIQPRLWSYMAGICKHQQMAAIAIGGMDDHSHVLFHLPQTLTLSKAIQTLKANSSKWMNEQGMRFAWQEGYGAFGVSVSNTPAVVDYIRNQENHHHKISFEDEYLALLKKHGIQFDPKYVFG
jgi:putative transposase